MAAATASRSPVSSASGVIRWRTTSGTACAAPPATPPAGSAAGSQSLGRYTVARPGADASGVAVPPRPRRSTTTRWVSANAAVVVVDSTRGTWLTVSAIEMPQLRPRDPPAPTVIPDSRPAFSFHDAETPTRAERDPPRERPEVLDPMSSPTSVHRVEWPSQRIRSQSASTRTRSVTCSGPCSRR
ncbi:hypothetical protein [Pseudonocardia sp. HH130630-07]|uniref:hypothetical protein n=1 Tax=Pseudonocardia sp. HH130630-07 TaxID=1690815 RepID=UPI000814DF75|nr:hypothetical protein [Pseudonocardia sp. HH130630-07]ANY05830.1 hypothetical protein AFB00_05415 [Pseudonocardia sp. HH130630-07]